MTTSDKIAEFLACGSGWTEAEQWVIRWQFGMLGDFNSALARAIALADDKNRARLRFVFPIQVEGFTAWAEGDLAKRLRDAGLDI